MKVILIITLGLHLFSFQKGHGQDVKEVLKKTQAAYQALNAYHVKMHISVYANEATNAPDIVQSAEVKKSGDNFHYRLEETEVLLNQKYLVTINNLSKEINYKSRKKGDLEAGGYAPEMSLDSLLDLYDTPEFLGESNGLMRYQFVQKRGGIDRIDLFIDKQSYLIKKVEYVYNPEVTGSEAFVRIQYEGFRVNPVLNPTLFTEKKFFTKRNGKTNTTEQYRSYRLVENSR